MGLSSLRQKPVLLDILKQIFLNRQREIGFGGVCLARLGAPVNEFLIPVMSFFNLEAEEGGEKRIFPICPYQASK